MSTVNLNGYNPQMYNTNNYATCAQKFESTAPQKYSSKKEQSTSPLLKLAMFAALGVAAYKGRAKIAEYTKLLCERVKSNAKAFSSSGLGAKIKTVLGLALDLSLEILELITIKK